MALDTDVTVALISAATTIIIVLISCCRGGKGTDAADVEAPLLPSPPANVDDPELGLETLDCPEHNHITRPNDPAPPTSPWGKVTAAAAAVIGAAVIGAAFIGAAGFVPRKERRANHEVEAPARPLDHEPSNVEDLSRIALQSQNGVRRNFCYMEKITESTGILLYTSRSTSEETSTMVEQSRQDSHSAPPTPRGRKQNHNNGVLIGEMENDEEETVGPREQVW